MKQQKGRPDEIMKSPDSMSLSKHRKACKDHGTQKSPRVRHLMMLEARKNERKAKRFKMFESIKQLFGGE